MTSALTLAAVSNRTATLLCTPDGTRFTLAAPLAWQVFCGSDLIADGVTTVAPVFLEGLTPATGYVFRACGAELAFETAPCAGLVDVTAHGASVEAADNSAAFARAIAAVPEGGTLMVPPGRYCIRPIHLKARMTLYLPKGAELYADHDRQNWPILPPHDDASRVVGTWEGLPEAAFAAPVTAIDCDNLTITGAGRIDAGGDRGDWWSWPKETRDGARRPRALFLAHGRNVQLSGFTLCNSPSWTLHPYRIDGLTCTGLNIENPPDSPNTDGLNPESCTDVRLLGIRFSVGDDCIAVKAGKRGPGQVDHILPTRGLMVHHCLMARGHGAVVLGSEMSGDITDVDVAACEFVGTDRGLRIKTRRGRGGKVAHVRLSDVVMTGVGTPLAINAFYFCDPDGRSEAVQSRDPAPVDHTTPQVFDISLTDVLATDVQIAGVALLGLPEAPITGVTIRNFRVSFDPNAQPAVPLMAAHLDAVRHIPLWTEFAQVDGTVDLLPSPQEAR
ncbi:polygalacturonase PglA [Pseudoprimorskyibacter insulae]|nr:glycoside hydrolase family 28 protein [Pseudoprimorskyibacter insulae]